jgi:hypothetical protein
MIMHHGGKERKSRHVESRCSHDDHVCFHAWTRESSTDEEWMMIMMITYRRQIEIVKDVCTIFPRIRVAIFSNAFFIETIDLHMRLMCSDFH